MLLCYLTLEGPQHRRHLSELFFSGTQNPMSSLRKTVMRLRQQAQGALEEGSDPLRASFECDARTLLTQLDAGELDAGVALHAGSFLAGLHLPDWSTAITTRPRIPTRGSSFIGRTIERMLALAGATYRETSTNCTKSATRLA